MTRFTPPPAPSVTRRVLLVDDEPHIGLLLTPQLVALGYRVGLARNLGEARLALSDPSARPDVVLLDLHLPDGSGVDLLRELRGRSDTKALPVIVVTAEGEDDVLKQARALDAQIQTKPFSPKKLLARLEAALGRRAPTGGDPA